MAAFAFFIAIFISYVIANDCSLTPVFVDLHERHVDGGLSIQYGLFAGVGTPSQNQSTWPSLSHNESIFTSAHFCDDSAFDNCDNQTHGIYVPEISSTFNENVNYKALDSSPIRAATIEDVGTDTFNIFTHYFDPSPPNATYVENFPVTILSNYTSSSSPWFGPSGQFGLGPSSTVLRRLYDIKAISSRSFALFVGTAYPRAGGALNGSLTLGGYDSGRFTEAVHNYTLSADYDTSTGETPFKVTVDKISVQHNDGSDTASVLSDTPFDAFLTTSQFGLTLPPAITSQFAELTNAEPPSDTSDDDSQNYLTLPSSFVGSMTFTLSTGLEVTIPGADLRNASNLSPINSSPLDDNSTTTSSSLFGSLFLSYLYLIANYDSSPPAFHLVNVDQHAPYVLTEPLCPDTLPQPYKAHKISSFAASGMAGAIIGGVIGGIGLSFAVWWCFVRCMRKRYAKQDEAQRKGLNDGNATDFVPRTGSLLYQRGRRGRKIDKSKNPISYMRERPNSVVSSVLPGPRVKSSPQSGSSDEEEGFDLTQFTTVAAASAEHTQPQRQASDLGAFNFASTDRLYQTEAEQGSRDRSISPPSRPITPTAITGDYHSNDGSRFLASESNEAANNSNRGARKPPSNETAYADHRTARSFTDPSSRDVYANIPITPNTPMPLLGDSSGGGGGSQPISSSSAAVPRQPGLGLSVNTSFPPPPRLGQKIKIPKQKHGAIGGGGGGGGKLGRVGRKMFPAT